MRRSLSEILSEPSFAHISDRDKGSMSAVPSVFPMSSQVHCFKHIVANINNTRNIPNVGHRVGDLWAVQAARNTTEYEARLAQLSQHNAAAAQYLQDIPGRCIKWALHKHVERNVPLHGHRTSNCIESENSRYLEAREMEPLHFLNKMTRIQLDLNNQSRDNIPAWEQKNMLLTARVQAAYKKQELKSAAYMVTKIDNTKALVSKPGDQSVEHTVEFKDNGGTCSCTEWQQHLMPCRHAIQANKILKFKEIVPEWYAYAFSPIYLLSNYKIAYNNPNIVPVSMASLVAESSDEVTRLPATIYKRCGRPKKKRKRKRTETADGRPAKVYRCSRCQSTEHNVKRCPMMYRNDM